MKIHEILVPTQHESSTGISPVSTDPLRYLLAQIHSLHPGQDLPERTGPVDTATAAEPVAPSRTEAPPRAGREPIRVPRWEMDRIATKVQKLPRRP
jgi:hypothetical protein